MRLCLVVHHATRPQRHIEGGIAALTARGHEVMLVALGEPGPLLDVARAAGASAKALGMVRIRGTPLTTARLASMLRDWRPDLAHAHEALPAAITGLATAPLRTPSLYHRHHLDGSARLRMVSRLASEVSAVTLAVSTAVARRAERDDRRSADRVLVAANGVEAISGNDTAVALALRTELGIDDGVVVVVVARLRHEKGHRHVFAALRRLVGRTEARVHLVVVGSGPEEGRLRESATGPVPGSVHFVGHQDDVAPWYSIADIVLLPSDREAMPLAALEAMSCGKPVVAFAVGGLPEALDDGRAGVLVPPGDVNALADALDALVRSPSRRSELGNAARQRHGRLYTPDAMVTAWEAGYQQVLCRRTVK